MRTGWVLAAAVSFGLALLAAGFLLGEPRGAVAWGDLRAVVLESDDWGFAGFAPDSAAWSGVSREELAPGRFPEAYWGSTLEDSSALAAMVRILRGARGRDGRSAVFQPNYIMFSLAPDGAGGWTRHGLPALPAAYHRPGLATALDAALASGVWHPELHGAWHYDPQQRRERAAATPVAARATRHGITVFPDAERARELGPWRPTAAVAADLDSCLVRFAGLFGRPPASVIAPDYTWGPANERLWQSRGLTVIQAKREQRDPGLPAGALGRLGKWSRRRWEALRHPQRTYLERNCRFETAQHPDPSAARAACLAEVRRAWEGGQPAIVETHRVNYVHLEAEVAAMGRAELAALLGELAGSRPAPLFLTDAEVAQLQRRGVSVVARGDRVVVRNAGRSRRVVAVPRTVLNAAAQAAGSTPPEGPLLVAVPAGMTLDLVSEGERWDIPSL